MFRFGGLSENSPSEFKTPASLVLIYRPNAAGMKGRVDLAQPVNRTQTCDVEPRYTTTRPYSMKN
ncbi:hypothetical protein TNCV_4685701, partial [Trichonephila clavipes]